jgi:hypothetical protein
VIRSFRAAQIMPDGRVGRRRRYAEFSTVCAGIIEPFR